MIEGKPEKGPSLTIVGTGIQLGQTTIEAKSYIENTAKVLFHVADPVTSQWIKKLNPDAENLSLFCDNGVERRIAYLKMIDLAMSYLQKGLNVCIVFYGHPGIFVFPTHEMIKRARSAGFRARMLPGVSAADCLIADLGIDMSITGYQSFEATDFLIRDRKYDKASYLILWQIATIGTLHYIDHCNLKGLQVLVDVLSNSYGSNHEIILYEASQYPICEPLIQYIPLRMVPESHISSISTLIIPPKTKPGLNKDIIEQLGMGF